MTGALLSVVTILLAVGVVSGDMRERQIYIVASKPLARWQYIVGRWLGVVLLDLMLLAAAGGLIYGFVLYLRDQPAISPEDRRAIDTEVLVARRRVAPEPFDVESRVEARLTRLKEDGRYDEAVNSYLATSQDDVDLARKQLRAEIRKQEEAGMQSVRPGQFLVWNFEGIQVRGERQGGIGRVTQTNPAAGMARIEADPHLVGRLVYEGPVGIGNVEGKVKRLENDFFDVQFTREDAAAGEIASLKTGQEVTVLVEPTIQVRYKASVAAELPDGMLYSIWQAMNPLTGLLFQEIRSDPVGLPATLTISAGVVDSQGQMELRYVNLPQPTTGRGTSVTVLRDDVWVLFKVGRFEVNFLGALSLMLVQVVFLAAIGVLAGSFLSFPVGCLASFAIMPFGLARGFLSDAFHLSPGALPSPDIITRVGGLVFRAMKVFLPDFAETSPGDALAQGMQISWAFVSSVALWTIVIRTVLILLLACLIFQKRELARVQV